MQMAVAAGLAAAPGARNRRDEPSSAATVMRDKSVLCRSIIRESGAAILASLNRAQDAQERLPSGLHPVLSSPIADSIPFGKNRGLRQLEGCQ